MTQFAPSFKIRPFQMAALFDVTGTVVPYMYGCHGTATRTLLDNRWYGIYGERDMVQYLERGALPT